MIFLFLCPTQYGNLSPGHIYREKHGLKGYTYPVFIATLFTIAKTWKQPKYLNVL